MEPYWYLAHGVRGFQATAGTTKLGTPVPITGNGISDATNYISTLITNFNKDRAAADTLFGALSQDEGDTSQLTLAPTDSHGTPVYKFALARIRTQDVARAEDVH